MEKEVRFQKIDLSYEEKEAFKKPVVRQNGPFSITGLQEGKLYSYCTCGLSAAEPFCDGSHQGTGFKSIKFSVKDQSVVLLCGCKRNKKESGAYCDGSHAETCNGMEEGDW